MPATKTGFRVPTVVSSGPLAKDKKHGKAWKAFFTKFAGTDLDKGALKKLPVMPELLDWEYTEGKGWKAVYSIEDRGSIKGVPMVGLTVHIIAPKRGYVGTITNVIAPRSPLAKDRTLLRMVAQGAVENAKGILEVASKGKVKRNALSPKREDYESRIRVMEESILRGAPLFDGVSWPRGTKVNKNWTYLQL